jgi:lysophospholipase L1-like esterase
VRLLLPVLLFACAPEGTDPDLPVTGDGSICAVGDSIFEWHVADGGSIPEVVGRELGREVHNAAVSGALVTWGEPDLPAIPDQYDDGAWSWLVLDGGGNDLNDLCGCGACDAVLDDIVTEDGRGGILPAFLGPVAESGVQVAFMTYPQIPGTAEFGFDRCGPVFEAYRTRLRAMAAFDDRIHIVDAGASIDGTDLSLFDGDHVHPSPEGSATMGRLIADHIRAVDP